MNLSWVLAWVLLFPHPPPPPCKTLLRNLGEEIQV